jgi:hypothetical protein
VIETIGTARIAEHVASHRETTLLPLVHSRRAGAPYANVADRSGSAEANVADRSGSEANVADRSGSEANG